MRSRLACAFVCVLLCLLGVGTSVFGQADVASVTGRVMDPNGAIIIEATVTAKNVETGVATTVQTNEEGIYRFANLNPGNYEFTVSKHGFKEILKPGVTLHLADTISMNFNMVVGELTERVTVKAGATMINTTDASLGTVVDQTYVKNMPLNGRSFQNLILLTPGIVTQSSQSSLNGAAGNGMTGEFSVNGQRTESNNYIVDGVSANLGAASGIFLVSGAGASGSLPGATALGTTQALVSVDDLQEFRVQSSTYSAEYGRNPGGQFSFETKSGVNQWHGTAYDYLRNDFFDANDWFNNFLKVAEPPLRQNDFGGTIGGPVTLPRLYNGKDKTFFFVSYEGLRLLQPQAASINDVPDDCLRGTNANCGSGFAAVDPAVQPVLKAFPVANGPAFGDGMAPFTASWSNPSSIDSASVRFDHVIGSKVRLFFRFSDTASDSSRRGTFLAGTTPSLTDKTSFTMRTYTGGVNTIFTDRLINDFRINYSSNETISKGSISAFGGSTAIDLAQITGLSSTSAPEVILCWDQCPTLGQGPSLGTQRQWNFVDTLNYTLGRHQFKFGVDYRRLTPFEVDVNPFVLFFYFSPFSLGTTTQANFADIAQALTQAPAYPLYKNFSAFAQDEWRISPRLNLSLGLRWDVNPPPGVTQGLMPYTVQGSSPATWSLAPQGTPLWTTAWFNFAPRLGAAYTLRDAPGRETVLRAGGGLFFDTGQQLGSNGFGGPGFSGVGVPSDAFGDNPPVSFPTLPVIPTVSTAPGSATPSVFPTHFQLPYTLQWNASIEQALGDSQSLTVSYVGAHAARLLRTDLINFLDSNGAPTTNANGWPEFFYINNGSTSDYHSAQVQYRRRLSHGLTALGSYTWAHCIDYGSQNYYVGYQRGSCDSDVRHNASTAFSYDVPSVGHSRLVGALLHHWGLDNRFTGRSGFPITVNGPPFIDPLTGKTLRAGLDLVANQPIYLYGANCEQIFQNGCPGGRAINPSAFTPVPTSTNTDPNTGLPLATRPGTAPRNFIRGFGAWQMDMAVRREFPLYESMKLQFRAEAFNIFNHPNFGAINATYCVPPGISGGTSGCNFGQPFNTLANSLGILSPLYQMGGPRSMQFALKLVF